MMNGEDNRRSFRISEPVYLKYDKLSEQEFRDGIDHRKLRLGLNDGAQSLLVEIEAKLGETMFMLNAEQSSLARCVTLLNDKLNVVIEELPSLRENKASLARRPPRICDVGADGMVFPCKEALQVGDKLHVRLLLSTDNRYIESFCEVIRLIDPTDTSDSEYRYGIAIQFANMPPAQREILIQHMFNRESETLRMRRLETESTEDLQCDRPAESG